MLKTYQSGKMFGNSHCDIPSDVGKDFSCHVQSPVHELQEELLQSSIVINGSYNIIMNNNNELSS